MLNYLTYLKAGGEDILIKYPLENYYYCQKCNRPCGARSIHNLINLGTITDNNTWVCDSCVIEWRREGRKIDPTDEYLVRHEWDVKFLEKMGMGGEKLLTAKKYAVKKIKQRYKDILLELPSNPALAVELEKIKNKYKNTSIISKKRIKSAKEESHVSNLPPDSLLYIDGQLVNGPNDTFPNQTATISSAGKGKYKVKIVSDYHLDLEDTIDVY